MSDLILSTIEIIYPQVSIAGWQGTLSFWAVLMVAALLNTVFSAILPYLEVFILMFHIIGFVAFILPLVYLSEHNTSEMVFSTFVNGGGWYSTGLAVIIGLNGNAGAFVGK